MDHNLDDSLNLDNSIGVEFEHGEDDVSQVDIGLGHEGEHIAMEFNHTMEEQPLLMESGNDEIIGQDFIGDQFTLQDYAIQDDQTAGSNVPSSTSQISTQNVISMDYETQNSSAENVPLQLVQIKAPNPAPKNTLPRPVMIAPKPPKNEVLAIHHFGRKQFVIAQGMRVVTAAPGKKVVPTIQNAVIIPCHPGIPASRHSQIALWLHSEISNADFGLSKLILEFFTKSSLAKVYEPSTKELPKIKLVPSGTITGAGGNFYQAQVVSGKPQTGNVLTKIVVQGQPKTQVAITKPQTVQPGTVCKVQSLTNPTKMIAFNRKTVPITKQLILSSPTQVKLAKKPVNAANLKSFVIRGSPLKNVAAVKATDTIVTSGASKTQLHQINVPGKGIQYIQIDTKPDVLNKAKTQQIVVPSKSVFISKGSLTKPDKVVSAGPPPLVFTGNAPINKLTGKPQQKLVRIAPLGSKTAQAFFKARTSQSLLAPMKIEKDDTSLEHSPIEDSHHEETEIDSKEALRALIADTVGESSSQMVGQKVEIEYDTQQVSAEQDISLNTHDYSAPDFSISQLSQDFRLQHSFNSEQEYINKDFDNSNQEFNTSQETPLIVIPSNYVKHHEAEVPVVDTEEMQLEYQDPELSGDPALRPRKACNCTKSQCLKLYCDCFANGEFCNKCNCINCHNNLANEELRQKAIRGCLDRNPNAFRPKIGKAKGGLDIIRRHNKGCNCKRSGCLKNYCECFEAKIACSAICKCVGCRNVEDTVERVRRSDVVPRRITPKDTYRPANVAPRQPCSFMTNEVVEAVCQCLIAAATESDTSANDSSTLDESCVSPDPIRNVIEEFSRCLQDIIGAAYHQPDGASIFDESRA